MPPKDDEKDKKTDDDADLEKTSNTGEDDDSSEDDDDLAKQEQIARDKFKLRSKKRDKKLEEQVGSLGKELSDLKENLSKLTSLIEKQKNEEAKDDKKDDPNKEFFSQVLTKIGSLEAGLNEQREAAKRDRDAQERREILADLGVKRSFISKVDKGIITIPEKYWEEDDFDGFKSFITDLNGFEIAAASDNGSKDDEKSKKKKSMPYKDDTVTSAVHTDKKNQVGLAESVSALNKGIKDTLKVAKDEKRPLSKSDLTAMMEAADKIDDING